MPSGKRSRLSKQNIQNQERNSNGYFLKRVLLCQECCVVLVVATVAAADVVAVVAAAAAAADNVFEILDNDDIDIIDDDEVWTR